MHGISWDSGDHEYKALGSLLRKTLPEAVKVYVIGGEKKVFMERFNYNVIDITDLGYFQIDMSKVVHFCSHHDYKLRSQCAAQNVKIMKKFLYKQKDWEDVSIEWEYA